MTHEEVNLLNVMESQSVIANSEKNLRSKIDSICRSLENLSAKKARIDFEIKRQKRTLTRKREELKRVSKGNQVKVHLTLESQGPTPDDPAVELMLRRLDSRLLQESDRLIAQD